MIDRNQIQAFTSNFPNLQGLKSIPFSLWLLLIVTWSNQQSGPNRDLTLPILISFTMILFVWFVDQYYKLTFGTIRQTGQKRIKETAILTAAGAAALACFIADSAFTLPFSLLGLMMAGSLLVDGIRIARSFPGRTFPFSWIFAGLLCAVSILPALGFARWWERFGVLDQGSAVLIITSVLMFFTGILWHYYLTKSVKVVG